MSLLLFIGALSVPGTLVLAQLDEAPFEWDHTFASPGTSLSADVLQTMSGPPNGMVVISIKASGFSDPAATLALWQKTGGQFQKLKPGILADGTVQLIPGVDSMMLGGYIRGQSFDIALVDEATNKRAHAKVTPFPITAEGDGGCKASAEVVTKSGLVWLITLAGYGAGEQVRIRSVAKKETLTDEVAASETGEIAFPILYPKRSKRNAQVTAEGSRGCNVSLDFAIGKSAFKAK
jgi:hypothetical protein